MSIVPRPGPFAEKIPWTVPQETPTHTPSQATPPKRQGALCPLPYILLPVFCLTSTEILNVLYSLGPVCVTKGVGVEQKGFSGGLGASGH